MTLHHDTPAGSRRRIERLIFAATFLAFAWFHQGGGWNQNARFALARAIVEEGRLSVDSFLVYSGAPGSSGTALVRSPIRDGVADVGGRRIALFWNGTDGRPVPLTARVEGRLSGVGGDEPVLEVDASGGPRFRIAVPVGTPVLRDGAPTALPSLVPGDAVRVELASNDGRRPVARGVVAGAGVEPGSATWTKPEHVAATGDLSFHAGRFHPAKAPGASFLAVPGHALLHGVGRLLGEDPDDAEVLTRRAWLASVLSVGLLAAIGCVVFFRLSLLVSGGRSVASLLSTIAFAFGTMYFPYATTLYEHDLIAALLLVAFHLAVTARASGAGVDVPPPESRARGLLAGAGLAAGMAAVTNYLVAGVVVLLAAYVVAATGRRRGWLWFGLGVLGPFLLLCAYNVACFGTPFTTNYRHEDPAFVAGGGLLGVFLAPQWDVLWMVLVSPFRGLFYGAPALLLGAAGFVPWFRSGRLRAEAWLSLGVLGFFLAFIVTFNGWHGGWAVGPRYLLPAVPFLALPAVLAFARAPAVASAVAAVSVALNLLVTAVDPQSPLGNAWMASVEGRPQWSYDPITEYEWPLFARERAWPILEEQRDAALRLQDGELQRAGQGPEARARATAGLRAAIDDAIRQGRPAPLLASRGPDGRLGLTPSELSTFIGPVSVNPMGVYEGWLYRAFPAGSRQARLNSFNAGERLFPGSRLSLLPLLAAEILLLGWALRIARREATLP